MRPSFMLTLANIGKVISVCSVLASPYLNQCPAFCYSTIAVTFGMCDKAYAKYNDCFLKSENKMFNFINQIDSETFIEWSRW